MQPKSPRVRLKLSVTQQIWIAFGTLLLTVGLGMGFGYWRTQSAERVSRQLVEVSYVQKQAADDAQAALLRAQAAAQRFRDRRDTNALPQLELAMADLRQSLEDILRTSVTASQRTNVTGVMDLAEAYLGSFTNLAAYLVRRGLKPDLGLEGQLRAAVHQVESRVKELKTPELEVLMLMCRRHEKDYLLRGDPKYYQDISLRIDEFQKKQAALIPDAKAREELDRCWTTYQQAMQQLVEGDDDIKAEELVFTQLATAIDQNVAQAAESATREIREARAQVLEELASGRRLMARALLGGALVGLVAGWWVSRNLGRMNRSVSRAASALQAGAGEVFNSSQQLRQSSQHLADDASHQAASLEETSASLEEISGLTRQNTDQLHEAGRLAQQAREAAERSTTDATQLSQAMNELERSSSEVARIVRTIDEIAFQTNLLALNAAVEAARAGEAGLGFAVVADEVRALARRSAEAARETADRIEVSTNRTQAGVAITTRVTNNLQDIAHRIREVDRLTAQVVEAFQEQGRGVEQVNTAVSQMDARVQRGAATAEESASAAAELHAQASALQSIVAELAQLVGTARHSTPAQPAAQPSSPAPSIPASQLRRSAPSNSEPLVVRNS